MPRSRALANRHVERTIYESAVKAFVTAPPMLAVRVKIGPKICRDVRQVTPAAMLSAKPFLKHLLTHGLQNCVVETGKLKDALRRELSAHPLLLSDWDLSVAVDDLAVHFVSLVSQLRNMGREELAGSSTRRYPRTGGFRKSISTAQYADIQELVNMVEVDIHTPTRTATHDDVDCDENGFPRVFSSRRDSKSTDDICAVECDERGSPLAFGSQREWGSGSKGSLDDVVAPIAPSPAKRKQAVLANRSGARTRPAPPATPKQRPKRQKKHDTTPTKTPNASQSKEKTVDDLPIVKTRLCVTSEAQPRAELIGFPDCGTRVHIATFNRRSWGSSFADDAKRLKFVIDEQQLTKKEAVQVRNGWTA